MDHFYLTDIRIPTPSNSVPCFAYDFPLSGPATPAKTPRHTGVSPLRAGKRHRHTPAQQQYVEILLGINLSKNYRRGFKSQFGNGHYGYLFTQRILPRAWVNQVFQGNLHGQGQTRRVHAFTFHA